MKHLINLCFSLLACFAFSACSSDDPIDDNTPTPVQPTQSGDDTWVVEVEGDITRGMTFSGDYPIVSFNQNDNIYVYFVNGTTETYVGTLNPSTSGGTSKKLIGTLTTANNTVTYASNSKLKFYYLKNKNVTYNSQQGTKAYVASNYAYAIAEATIKTVNPNTHTLTVNQANFEAQQAIVALQFSEKLLTGDVITISGGGIISTVKVTTQSEIAASSGVVYVALPLNTVSSTRTFNIAIKRGTTNNALIGTISGAQSMANGKYYTTKTVTVYRHMSLAASGDIGKVIKSNGYIYPSGTSGGTGVIVYVGTETGNSTYKHGIVLNSTNEGGDSNPVLSYSGAQTKTSDKNTTKPISSDTNIKWEIPTIDQWETILKALTKKQYNTEYTLSTSAQPRLVNVPVPGATHNLNKMYWSSSTSSSTKMWCYRATDGTGLKLTQNKDNTGPSYIALRTIYCF